MKIIDVKDINTINAAAKVIGGGGLVVYPSDTVYILAVDATNQKAVDKLLGFKDRWTGKAISVAVTEKKMAKNFVELDKKAEGLYDRLLPGPFTIVSKGKHKVAKGIEAENGTLGIRIPDSSLVMELVKKVGKPVTATSANLSGRAPHYSIESLLNTLSEKKKTMIDLIVDGGKLPKNKPSTVIDITEPDIKILRRGDLVTGRTETLVSKSEDETEKIARFVLKKSLSATPLLPLKKGIENRALVFGLTGDLGCGKTVFSRAIGKSLGVKEKITSPTFFVFNEYEISPNPLFEKDGAKSLGTPASSRRTTFPFKKGTTITKFLHFDLYRIREEYELEEINFLEMFGPGIVACIEWPENMGENYLTKLKEKTDFVMIGFEYVDEETREIRY